MKKLHSIPQEIKRPRITETTKLIIIYLKGRPGNVTLIKVGRGGLFVSNPNTIWHRLASWDRRYYLVRARAAGLQAESFNWSMVDVVDGT